MSAAKQLAGLTVGNGWKVSRHLARDPNGTGGVFSESYEVHNGARRGFLKAFDFSGAFAPAVDTTREIERLVKSYNHEKEILQHCEIRGLSNVVIAIDSGHVQVPMLGTMEGRVFYLIFEMAQGDIRVQMDLTKRFNALLCMKALKDVTLGLRQVHKEMIAHQDMKPSNVLVYPGEKFKVSDFGRSSRKGQAAAHDTFTVAGDRTYAPPELLYGFMHGDFAARRLGCDMFMLGNLATFLFSGVNMTSLLLSLIDDQHKPRQWGGSYADVKPYLQSAFSRALKTVEPLIEPIIREEVMTIINEQCNPDLDARGHPRGIAKYNQYSLERYVSIMDATVKRLQIKMRAAA